MCRTKNQGQVSHDFLPLSFTPLEKFQTLQKLCWGCCGPSDFEVTLRKEARGWNPDTRRPEYQVIPSQVFGTPGSTIPPSLKCACLSLAVLPGPRRYHPVRSGAGTAGPRGAVCWHIVHSSLSPMIVSTWKSRLLRLQECDPAQDPKAWEGSVPGIPLL